MQEEDVYSAVATPFGLDDQLVAFLTDDTTRTKIPPEIHKCLKLAAAKFTRGCRFLEREEVVQQAVLVLLENPCRFDPTRGTAIPFLWQVTHEAARSLRAAYATPGSRKRAGASPEAMATVSLDDMTEADWEEFGQTHHGGVDAIEAGCDVRRLAEHMSPALAIAFSRIADGEPKKVIAAEMGIDRFALERAMARFRRQMGLVPEC
jgi:hypothetical protein